MNFPKRYNEFIPLTTLAEGHCKSIENAKRLIEDGKALMKNKRYLGAINSLRLAIEEVAKAHLITQAASYKKNEKDRWKWFWKVFRSHKKKLELLEYDLHWKNNMDETEFNRGINALIETREKSIYVHFDENKKIFITPKEIFESIPTIEETAQMELKYASSLFSLFTIAGIPTPKIILSQYKMYKEEKTNSE